jgi:hypothetical protein
MMVEGAGERLGCCWLFILGKMVLFEPGWVGLAMGSEKDLANPMGTINKLMISNPLKRTKLIICRLFTRDLLHPDLALVEHIL